MLPSALSAPANQNFNHRGSDLPLSARMPYSTIALIDYMDSIVLTTATTTPALYIYSFPPKKSDKTWMNSRGFSACTQWPASTSTCAAFGKYSWTIDGRQGRIAMRQLLRM